MDTQYFAQLTDKINAVDTCPLLQDAVDEAFATIQAQLDGIALQLDFLEPLQALLSLSITDLPSVITAVKDIITLVVGPVAAAYAKYAAEIAALTAAVVSLETAISNAASRIGSCSVTLPSLVIPTP